MNVPKVTEIFKFQLLTNNQVWAACWNGIIIHTDDNGESWKALKVNQLEGTVRDIFFIDKTIGWIAGYPNFGVYKTVHSGLSWQQQVVSDNIIKSITINSLHFFNVNEGWIVGQDKWKRTVEHKGIVQRTRDGGLSWETVPVKGNRTIFRKICFTSQQEGWLVDYDNIYRTTDKGKTWRRVLSLPPFKESDNDVFLK